MITNGDQADFERLNNGDSMPTFLRRPTREDLHQVEVIMLRARPFRMSWVELVGLATVVAGFAFCLGYLLGHMSHGG